MLQKIPTALSKDHSPSIWSIIKKLDLSKEIDIRQMRWNRRFKDRHNDVSQMTIHTPNISTFFSDNWELSISAIVAAVGILLNWKLEEAHKNWLRIEMHVLEWVTNSYNGSGCEKWELFKLEKKCIHYPSKISSKLILRINDTKN